MSNQPFERAVAIELAKANGIWATHPADVAGSRKRGLPADFIWGYGSSWGLLEVKSTIDVSIGPRAWPAHQRNTARDCLLAGGRYLLLARFQGRGDCLWEVELRFDGDIMGYLSPRPPVRYDSGLRIELNELPSIIRGGRLWPS